MAVSACSSQFAGSSCQSWDSQALSRNAKASTFAGSSCQSWDSLRHSWVAAAEASKPCRQPVLLHIYDVSRVKAVEKLNGVLAPARGPVQLGGIFHAGVEVNGVEWHFGGSGIITTSPRTHPTHHHRQTIVLSPTELSEEEVERAIAELHKEYGNDYDFIHRNCCRFADDLCKKLGVAGLPKWVHRLARGAAWFDRARWGVEAVIRPVSQSLSSLCLDYSLSLAPVPFSAPENCIRRAGTM